MSPQTRQSTLSFQIKKNPTCYENIKTKKDGFEIDTSIFSPKVNDVEIMDNDVSCTPRKNNLKLVNPNALTPSSAFATLDINSPNGLSKLFKISSNELPCREMELKEIETFLASSVLLRGSASMYISGLPGTGKTAALTMVLENKEVAKECHTIFVNCTAVKSSGAIYLRIAESLKLKLPSRTEKSAINAIEKHLFKKPTKVLQKMVLLVLDEIDQLESKFQSVLYKIFEWPSMQNSRLVLIGIANAVDLTNRMLPRLRSLQHPPKLLHFLPYSKEQIVTILKHRLAQSKDAQKFAPGSLELISAKVAVQSGDLRRALDLGRRVLEVSKSKSSPSHKLKVTIQSPEKNSTNSNSFEQIKQTPKKILDILNSESILRTSPRKRPFCDHNDISSDESLRKTPKKSLNDSMCSTEKENKIVSRQRTPGKATATTNASLDSHLTEDVLILRRSPRKQLFLKTDGEPIKSPVKTNLVVSRRSPRKQLFSMSGDEMLNNPTGQPDKLTNDINTIRAHDVLSIMSQTQGSACSLKKDQSAFPLHQKLLVCSLLLILTKGKNKDITIGKLHEVYSRVCNRRGISAVDQSGFIFLCRQVEMTGAVEIGKGHGRLAKITLQWDESEVSHALQDSTLLTAIMCDSSVLTKRP